MDGLMMAVSSVYAEDEKVDDLYGICGLISSELVDVNDCELTMIGGFEGMHKIML